MPVCSTAEDPTAGQRYTTELSPFVCTSGTKLPKTSANPSTDGVAVELIHPDSTDFEDLTFPGGTLFQEWCSLWSRLSCCERDPATHPAWLAAYLRRFSVDSARQVQVFVCRRNRELIGVLPFEVECAPTISGVQNVLNHMDEVPLEGASLAARTADIAEILNAVLETRIGRRRTGMVVFGRVDNSHALHQLQNFRRWATPAAPRSVIDMSGGYEAVLQRVGRNFRGNLRKARNRLQAHGRCHVSEARSEFELNCAFERMIDIEARSWKAQEGSDLATDGLVREFFASLIAPMAAESRMVIHILSAGDDDVAGQLSLVFDDELWVQKVSYADAYARLAPGNLLLEHTLREFCPRFGIRRVNLVTHLDWHAKWKPDVEQTFCVQILPAGIRGRLSSLCLIPVREWVREILRKLHLLETARRVRDTLRRTRAAGTSASS